MATIWAMDAKFLSQKKWNARQQRLIELWEAHLRPEFETKDAAATLETMGEVPYVNHVPTLTGGYGRKELYRFYANHFIPQMPEDTQIEFIWRTVDEDTLVDEFIFTFTHDREMDFLLPGVAPTGKYVEVPMVASVYFDGDKVVREHIYWDQASVLVQLGLLKLEGLPVAGRESAEKLRDPSRLSNRLINNQGK